MSAQVDAAAVLAAMQEAAAVAIEPRFRALFRALSAGDVEWKAPGEIATIADREAELLLTQRLGSIAPGVPVVGEEASATDPGLLSLLSTAPRVWLVDPLDGTANFVAGSPDYAVMVALVEGRRTVASWIWQPARGVAYYAERAAGAYRDNLRLHRSPAPRPIKELRGAVLSRFLDHDSAELLTRTSRGFAAVTPGSRCAGVDYPLLAEGAHDFVLYSRALPWDHAPGALLAAEAGCSVLRLDGSPYRPHDARAGLLAAADAATWTRVRAALLDPEA